MFDVNSEFSVSTKQRTAVHRLFYILSRVAAYIFILRVNHSLRPIQENSQSFRRIIMQKYLSLEIMF